MRNNVIAIIAISCMGLGGLWGVGNLLNPPNEADLSNVHGILLLAQRSTFNGTNPDIHVKVNVPTKLVVVNKDIVIHNLIINDKSGNILNIDTAPLQSEQHFNAAIVAYAPGMYLYYCEYHSGMQGKIIAES